ncbi:MAG TPA: acyltransferase family protein [Candidatus Limnocylindria bacterium]|nr:acyltransferase family protein [Candidatus Limnocylindria bacterium]
MRADAAYHPALDGIRALAVTAVLLFHAEIPGAAGGFLGVSTFFTLSGFLITRLLLADLAAAGRIDLRRFWTRRFRRLMPASLLGLALVLVLAPSATPPETLGRLRGDVLAALAYVSNWRFMQTAQSYFAIFEDPSPVQHFWSLSIEEQFYLVYPLLVLGLWRLRPRLVAGLAVPLAALALLTVLDGVLLAASGASQARVYYGTDTRAPELLVGALLALWMARPEWRPPSRALTEAGGMAALAASVAAVVVLHENSPALDRGGLAAYGVATAALLHAAVRPTLVARVLSFEPLRRLGRISYGVYVYHWPVFLWLDAERTGLALGALVALRVSVTIALAAASYALVEWPIRSGRVLRAGLWPAAAGAAACLVAATMWTTRQSVASVDLTATLAELSMGRMPSVTPVDGVSPLRVLVVGDSVAGDMGTGLWLWAKQSGTPLAVWNLGWSACAIGRGGTRPAADKFIQLKEHCANWPQYWAAAVERFDPDVVVVHTGPLEIVDRQRPEWGGRTLAPGAPEFDAWLLGELQAAADVLATRGARVVWLTTPCTGPPVSPRLPLAAIGSLDPRRVLRFNEHTLVQLRRTRPDVVRIFDLFRKSCPRRRFMEKIPGRPGRLRKDHLHYTTNGALWVAYDLGPVVVEEARRRRGS